MPLTLAKLQQHNPHLDIKIHTGLITDLIPRVASGELEFSLGVNASPLSIKLGDKFGNIEFERIVDDRLVIIASRSHPLCQRPHVSIDELSASGWIVPRISSCSMPALNKVFNLDTATHPRNIVTVETAVLAKSTVAQSQFLTLMAELNVQKEIAAGDIVILNVPDFNAPIEIGFFFNRGTMLSELATWSRDALRQGVMDAKLESSKLKKLMRT
jgi:DNA-binding transcriptional LysR family regulator